jgi:hypothetical protein
MKIKSKYIQGDSRIILTPTELKMQPTIHLEGKAGFYRVHIQLYVPNVCVVGCIFNSVGLIITRDS